MNCALKPFFTEIFLKTNGYLPVFTFDDALEIGDYFLIANGEVMKLGGLKGNEQFFDLEEPLKISEPYRQPRNNWQSDHLINTSFKSSGTILEWDNIYLLEDQQAVIVEFLQKGSYFFRTNEVITRRFVNFHFLSEQILQKFVTKEFNFKELYLVTEEVHTDDYAIAVSGKHGNLAIEFRQNGYYELMDLVNPEVSCYPSQSRNISYIHLQDGGKSEAKKPAFIRAVKLDVSFEGEQKVSEHIREYLPDNMSPFYSNMMEYAKTSILKLTNVFPGNAVDYYSFCPMQMSDVNKLFS